MFMFNLIIFMLLLFENEGSKQLCSTTKSSSTCICKRITNEWNLVVTVADCARINLQEFPDQTQLQSDVNVLDVSRNQITILDADDHVNSSYVTLETLNLSYNFIERISSNFFNKMSTLQNLILSHNNISSLDDTNIFMNCKKLMKLDLSFNNIKMLPERIFLPLVELQMLDLSYNAQSLGELLTQSSDYLHSNLGLSPNISYLEMNNIGLKDLHNLYFDKYTNLEHLSLADNHFTDIPNVPYSVKYLDLSGSDVTVLQGKYFDYHSLKVLKLERMKKLESIHHYAFYNLEALEELSITDSHHLKEFNELVFGIMSNKVVLPLKKLTLARNSLETLNYTYKFLFRRLDHIDLSDNLWKCDCDLLWFQEFDNFYKKENIKCSSPSFLNNKMVLQIVDQDLPSCYPEKYGKKAHRILIPILILLILILSALIGYFIYIAPSWYGNRARRVGPQSPYSVTRLEGD